MVVGHSHLSEYLKDVIYLFHMPLFFFCSGYFFKPNEDLFVSIRKKIKRLYIPYFKYALVWFVLIVISLLFSVHIYSFNLLEYAKDVPISRGLFRIAAKLFVYMALDEEFIFVAFWFVRVLFWTTIFASVISFIDIKLYKRIKFHILSIVFILCIPLTMVLRYYSVTFYFLGGIHIITSAMFFYFSGYYYHKIENKSFYKLPFVILGLCCLFFVGYYWEEPSMLYSAPIKVVLYNIIALIGIVTTLGASYLLEKKSVNWLYYIGNHTFSVFALHFIFFKILTIIVLFISDKDFETLNHGLILEMPFYYYILYIIVGVFCPLISNEFYLRAKRFFIR